MLALGFSSSLACFQSLSPQTVHYSVTLLYCLRLDFHQEMLLKIRVRVLNLWCWRYTILLIGSLVIRCREGFAASNEGREEGKSISACTASFLSTLQPKRSPPSKGCSLPGIHPDAANDELVTGKAIRSTNGIPPHGSLFICVSKLVFKWR